MTFTNATINFYLNSNYENFQLRKTQSSPESIITKNLNHENLQLRKTNSSPESIISKNLLKKKVPLITKIQFNQRKNFKLILKKNPFIMSIFLNTGPQEVNLKLDSSLEGFDWELSQENLFIKFFNNSKNNSLDKSANQQNTNKKPYFFLNQEEICYLKTVTLNNDFEALRNFNDHFKKNLNLYEFEDLYYTYNYNTNPIQLISIQASMNPLQLHYFQAYMQVEYKKYSSYKDFCIVHDNKLTYKQFTHLFFTDITSSD